MMPNLKAKILSPQEIKMIYGLFENKKGFIIDGTIVLNHDRFDSTTVFHEFGHARWLSEYNPGAHAALMENVQNTYQSDIPWYSAMYNTTGLKHSETDVVEVFVDQLGLAAKNLEKL
jgi:glycine cleavage system aminomethyltransferase T